MSRVPVQAVAASFVVFPSGERISVIKKDGDVEEKWELTARYRLTRYARWRHNPLTKLIDTVDPAVGGEAKLLTDRELDMVKREVRRIWGNKA